MLRSKRRVEGNGWQGLTVVVECYRRSVKSARHEYNEDEGLCCLAPLPGSPTLAAVVADGVSGGGLGWYASRLTASTLIGETLSFVMAVYEASDKLYCQSLAQYAATGIKRAFEAADQRLKREFPHTTHEVYAASTASLALVACERLYIGHVGDTRIYLSMDGSRPALLTRDQSRGNMLLSFLGSLARAKPSIQLSGPYDLSKARTVTLILVSDGVHRCVDIAALDSKTLAERSAKEIADGLVGAARKAMEGRGCPEDDATAVVAKIRLKR